MGYVKQRIDLWRIPLNNSRLVNKGGEKDTANGKFSVCHWSYFKNPYFFPFHS